MYSQWSPELGLLVAWAQMFKILTHSVGIGKGVNCRLLRVHTRPVDKFIILIDPLLLPVGNSVIALKVLGFIELSITPCAACTNCPNANGRSRLKLGRMPVKSCRGLANDRFEPLDLGIRLVTYTTYNAAQTRITFDTLNGSPLSIERTPSLTRRMRDSTTTLCTPEASAWKGGPFIDSATFRAADSPSIITELISKPFPQ